jgi:hypothetical protein
MKRLQAIMAAAMAISLAGCVVNGKPKTVSAAPPPPAPAAAPAPPAEPLSIPQTQVELPPPQPVTPEALATTQPPEQAAAPSAAAGARPPRRAAPANAPAALPAEPERPPVQEILNPAESKRLQDLAGAHKREIRQWLTPARARRLNQDTVSRIQSFLKASDDAENRGDMRQANALAERALILLRELQGAQ